MIPILSIVGRSNSGKTTLLEKLIRELTRRGRQVGTIKHHFHGPVEVDVPGKDSWRHKHAGARTVALSSPDTLFMIGDVAEEWTLETIAHQALFAVDLILTEGFKSGPMPKVEVNRAAQGMSLLCGSADHLVAVVTDRELTSSSLLRPGCGGPSGGFHRAGISEGNRAVACGGARGRASDPVG